jgi:hypothetical protein
MSWGTEEKFDYIAETVEMLGSISNFKLHKKAGYSEVDWRDILLWWLDPQIASQIPSIKQIGYWHKYVKNNFQYRFNWGLGNFIALTIDESLGGRIEATSIEDWPNTGLPWIVIWLKELIIWGTLDPVAAYILARGLAVTRPEAESMAQQYYSETRLDDINEILNAVRIRKWTERQFPSTRGESISRPQRQIKVDLLRDFTAAPDKTWRVLPVEIDSGIQWIDPAGFPLAESPRVKEWSSNWLHDWDFYLDHENRIVSSSQYLP